MKNYWNIQDCTQIYMQPIKMCAQKESSTKWFSFLPFLDVLYDYFPFKYYGSRILN